MIFVMRSTAVTPSSFHVARRFVCDVAREEDGTERDVARKYKA